MVDSNVTITVTFKVVMDIVTVWCNAECDDAMLSNFSGLSKNVRYQQQHQDDLIKR
jgi:hypothetical protein